MTNSKKAGFTLIEMSVVLVIIGLIVAGIFLGQSLIRQSQLASAMTDAQKYIQAAQNFQQKYGALPGDFANAQAYWNSGAAPTCPSTYAAQLTPPTTCNGDGNGQIGTSGSGGSYAASAPEYFLFWEHLSDAQLISGIYNGSPGSAGGGTGSDHVIGTNAPASKLDGAGFGVTWVGVKTSGTTYYYNSFGHVFIFGGYSSNFLPAGNIMTTLEALSLDTKYDDGLPSSGNIQSWQQTTGYSTACTTSATTAPTTKYDKTQPGYKCSLILLTGF